MTDHEKLIAEARTHRAAPGYQADTDMIRRLADALEAVQKARTPTDERNVRALVRRAVGGVLFNASNFPEPAQSHLLGQNMGPLNEKLTNAVLDALHRSEAPEPTGPHCDGCAKYAHHHCYHCGKRPGLPHPTWCPNSDESAPDRQPAANDLAIADLDPEDYDVLSLPLTVEKLPPAHMWLEPMQRTTSTSGLPRVRGTLRGHWPRLGRREELPGENGPVTVTNVDLFETADGHLHRSESRWPDGCRRSFNELVHPDEGHIDCDRAGGVR